MKLFSNNLALLATVTNMDKYCKICGNLKERVFYPKQNRTRYMCRPCDKIAALKQYWSDPEKYRKISREQRINNPVVNRYNNLRRIYGLSPEDYAEMFVSQGKVCAICKLPSDKNLHIDHDHKSGKVRGLLCSKCNTSLGLLNDDIKLLQAAANYLAGSIVIS